MKKLGRGKQAEKALGEEKSSRTDDSLSPKMWKIFDISLFSGDKHRVLNIIGEKIDLGTKKYWIATVNPEFVMATFAADFAEATTAKKASAAKAAERNEFFEVLKRTNLNVVDGIGLIWAKQMLRPNFQLIKAMRVGVDVLKGKYKNQISSGADLILDLAKIAKEKNKKIFLLGGWNGRAEKTAEFLKKDFNLRGEQLDWSDGEPKFSNDEVIKKINKFKPDILLVAYGMKKQEFWIDKNLKNLDVGLVMGVGRSFDYYSGELKRAPDWVRKMGMEWLYSLIKEPKRIKRQLVLPKFVWKVITN